MSDPNHLNPQQELHVSTGFAVLLNGQEVTLTATDIADHTGLNTILDGDVLLDWHNILTNPGEARIHMFLGADKSVEFDEKLRRMRKFASSISSYQEIMQPETRERFTPKEVMDMLGQHHLPLVKTVTIDTGTAGLRKLFDQLGFPVSDKPPHPYVVDWLNLVDVAQSGSLIDAWVKQKQA